MLDAMVGLEPALADLGRAAVAERARRSCNAREDAQGLRIAYASDIAGHRRRRRDRRDLPARRARRLQKPAPRSSEIAFDVLRRPRPLPDLARRLDGRPAVRAAGACSSEFGANLKGNVKAGLELTALDLAAAEQQREQVFQRFRELFERYDFLLTPARRCAPYPRRR